MRWTNGCRRMPHSSWPSASSSWSAARLRCSRKFLAAALLGRTSRRPAPPRPPRFVVVLDAAHGGDDTGGTPRQRPAGKSLHSRPQRPAALAARRRAASRWSPPANPTPRSTPNRRAEIANHANAQACLSLHASESGSGVHLFVSSLAPAQPARFRRLEDRAGRLGHRAAWPWPGCSTPPCCTPA